jgi:hypothetical protein
MPCFLLPLWILATIMLWVFAVGAVRESRRQPNPNRPNNATAAIVVVAIPPTLVLVVSGYVLLQAAPTVQFNAGNARALELWSFWVHWWHTVFGCSAIQVLCYLVWCVILFVKGAALHTRYVAVCGFLSALIGSMFLSMAYPSA